MNVVLIVVIVILAGAVAALVAQRLRGRTREAAVLPATSMAVPLLEAIEQRATEAGVPVDSRIERGRNRRHALRQAIAQERFDRIVIAAATKGTDGFDADDVAWLLDNAGGEIVVLRPATPEGTGVRTGRAVPVGSHSSEARVPSEWHARLNRAGEMAGSR